MQAFDASLYLFIHVYNLFNIMAFESRVSASTVHICIIRLLLEPRDLPGEDGGTEVKVKACKSVGQVVDTHWLDMVYLN